METVTVCVGSLTIQVDRNFVRLKYYDGAEHSLKLNRQNMSYLQGTPYLQDNKADILRAVAVWEEFFGKGIQQIAI